MITEDLKTGRHRRSHHRPSPLALMQQLRRMSAVPEQTSYVTSPDGLAEWAEATRLATEKPQCTWCGEEGHHALVRITPRPDPNRPDALDELVQACSCCAFGPVGHPTRGLLARLRGEQAESDDHDLTIEVLTDGRWIA